MSEVSQTIDLSQFLDADYSEADKLSLGQELIDKMVERVESGQGLKFDDRANARVVKLTPQYSDKYAESVEFKAAGKSKNKVNMKLTGDMLADITVEPLDGAKLKITFNDETQIAKAYNHMEGDTVPKRTFFGVSKSDVKEALKGFEPKDTGPRNIRLLDLLRALDGDTEDQG